MFKPRTILVAIAALAIVAIVARAGAQESASANGPDPMAFLAHVTNAKLLAADASWEAANVCMQTFGGFGFAAEYDIERKFRETRLYQVAPISTNMILSYIGEHVLGMPRSF